MFDESLNYVSHVTRAKFAFRAKIALRVVMCKPVHEYLVQVVFSI